MYKTMWRVTASSQAKLWVVVLGGVLFGAVGVVHVCSYFVLHPGPAVPPIELAGFLTLGFVPEFARQRRYEIAVNQTYLFVVDQDGERSCPREKIRALAVRSERDLAPKRGDPWRLTALGTDGAKLVQVRAAQRFGEQAARDLSACLGVPLQVQPPLFT
jgi:hypothetical protein